MADDSRKPLDAQRLSESERSAFYAWAHEQGFTRLNATCEDLQEELWFDRKGKIMSAGKIVRDHPDWKLPSQKAAAPPRRKPAVPFTASINPAEWLRLLPTATLGMVLVGASQFAFDSSHVVATSTPNQSIQTSVPSSDRTNLGLMVTSLSKQLQIRWDHESPAILASANGVMKITENGVTEIVPFDQQQLRDGSVAYGAKTNDVSIRLEVTDKDGATMSESVRSVAIP